MTPAYRLSSLTQLGERLSDLDTPYWETKIAQAQEANGWFTPENIRKSLSAIRTEYLDADKLSKWVTDYSIDGHMPQRVAIVMAGNLPLVGFHDLLCCYVAGHETLIKCSSKDEVLVSAIIEQLSDIDPANAERLQIVEQLKDFDAVIATGGDTAATHFEYYFKKYPHIIRKNRNSIAILTGDESDKQLQLLADDVFDYFGLGCRSVSKVYIPQNFNTDRLFEAFGKYQDIIHHNKYKNNFDYNHAIYVLTQQPCLTNDVIILHEDPSIASRIACLHYERYRRLADVLPALDLQKESIQCLSSVDPIDGWQHIPLGQCQRPGLADYADDVDTMYFLTNL